MSTEVGRECFVERPMLRKLLSVALMALGMGLAWPSTRRRERATRVVPRIVICPVPQECGGHIEYQLQRQTVLQNVSGDRLRDATGPVRADRLRDGHAAQDDHHACENVVEQSCPRRSRTRSSGRVYRTVPAARSTTRSSGRSSRTVWKDVTYTVCRPVRETHLETRTYTVCRPVRETTLQDVRLQRLPRRSARSRYKDVCYTVCRPVQETVIKTVNYTVCRPVQETCYKTCVYTVCRPGAEDVRRGAFPYTVQVPVQQTVMQCQADTEMVPVRQCAYKQVPYTVCRQVRETVHAGVPVHGQVPGPADRDADLHVHRLPPGAGDRHEGVPLHGLPAGPDDPLSRRSPRPATRPSPRRPAARSARRSACRGPSMQAGLPATVNEAVVERYYVPGKTVCVNGCLYQCPGTWC